MFQKAIGLLLATIPSAWSFMVDPSQVTGVARVGRTVLNYNQGPSHSSKEDQLDEKRRFLEYLMQGPCSADHPSDQMHVAAPSPHRLTSGTRKRYELEIELLDSLAESDEAIPHLMNLWVHECPAAAAEIEKLQYIDRLSPAKAETMLRSLVEQYPEWPEPAARLALLVGLNHSSSPSSKLRAGEQALYYMDQVMQRKPWHFEVQHMQVLLSLQHHNMPRAIRAARIRLPPRTQPKRRAHWVKTAVAQAKEQLKRLEQQAALPRWPGDDDTTRDSNVMPEANADSLEEEFPDAWQ